jgi:putative membrane protein
MSRRPGAPKSICDVVEADEPGMVRGRAAWSWQSLTRCVGATGQCSVLTVRRFNVISISDLPALNASLNLTSTVFISMGWYFIRHGAWRRHMACMITAVVSSACFLTGYIIYHANVGEKSSGYSGWIAAIYFPILATHVLLAFVTLPLVIITLIQVFGRRWDRHRRIARWTIPIWLYVSATGVLVYLVLYKWFPPGA